MSAVILHVAFHCHDPERMATFWAGLTGYQRTKVSNDDVVTLRASGNRGVQKLLFYRTPGPTTTQNRVYLDLAAMDLDTEMDKLLKLGATRIDRRQGDGTSWTVMLDPEGNEFCIA